MPHKDHYELLTHDEGLAMAAKLIDIGLQNIDALSEVLTPGLTEAEKRKKMEELLMHLAEDFDISPDLIIPGEGFRRRDEGKGPDRHYLYSYLRSPPRKRTKFETSDKDKDNGSTAGTPAEQNDPFWAI